MKPKRIRVHVVHESRMVAEAISVQLKTLLPGASVDGWTKSWETYVSRSGGVADVVVIDNELGNGGPTAFKVSSLVRDGTGVVVLGRSLYVPAIRRIYEAGAHAYLLPEEPSEAVAAAIWSAYRNTVLRPVRITELFGDSEPVAVPVLTARELQVVGAYVSGSGASVPETAARFGLSSETVRTHISHARRKYTGADGDSVSKMELRRRMIKDGWILG
ncbi:helix-turn-helix transcriptional regulator [Subtercola sp. RTI3]|uniref:helix-turn-helix transcriptional regulator n=1 Tax=Subtercola sp. RTI3 TaxID=3048639 RepID=UPI002B23C311|nr:sigma factor-like helix-turn-helix DNA-binding protein [Subtercola sp. RTI3]MEA9985941.1 sigma factor-like helix-turn-helix DNA-binding protein [Subtercola sp. RTI3]